MNQKAVNTDNKNYADNVCMRYQLFYICVRKTKIDRSQVGTLAVSQTAPPSEICNNLTPIFSAQHFVCAARFFFDDMNWYCSGFIGLCYSIHPVMRINTLTSKMVFGCYVYLRN